ncbi:MAG: hypothetical protein U9R79_02125 [Armatimonadota bacterium]|nr:hypothetical protein [Armatimonadota bacterium]
MAPRRWLELGDQFLLDDADWEVVEVLAVRGVRRSLRLARVQPVLGGQPRLLLQTEDALFEAEPASPEDFGESVAHLEAGSYRRQWSDEANIERARGDTGRRFTRGTCTWYAAEDGSVALVIDDTDEQAVVGAPLAPARIDLSFTDSRRGGRD